jgi:hypothetical protein
LLTVQFDPPSVLSQRQSLSIIVASSASTIPGLGRVQFRLIEKYYGQCDDVHRARPGTEADTSRVFERKSEPPDLCLLHPARDAQPDWPRSEREIMPCNDIVTVSLYPIIRGLTTDIHGCLRWLTEHFDA